MKFFPLLFISTLLLAAPSGIYVEANFENPQSDGISVEDSEYVYDKGLAGTVAVGYQMDQWRFEVESNYSQNALKSFDDTISNIAHGDIVQAGGLVNVYYSAYNNTKLVSTIGLGVGATEVQALSDIDDSKVKTDPSLTYQGSVSLGYMLDEDWTWTIKYRYLDIKDTENENQAFSFGIRYLF